MSGQCQYLSVELLGFPCRRGASYSQTLLGLASPQQEFQGQEGEDVSLLKQGPKIDVRTHLLLDGATRAACNREGKTMSLSLEGWVGLGEGMSENW